jgi:uncharacterized protein YnzC (UPF0291/DUF896 family)
MEETESVTWPRDRTQLGAHLRAQYLDRGKQSLKDSLAKLMIKGVIDPPEGNSLIADRLAEAAHALAEVAPDLLTLGLESVLKKRIQGGGLSGPQSISLLGRIGDMKPLWNSVPEAAKPGLVAAIAQTEPAALAEAGVLSIEQADLDAAKAVQEVLAQIMQRPGSLDLLAKAISRHAGEHLWPLVLQEIEFASDFRSGEQVMIQVVMPYATKMSAERVRELGEALLGNGQVRMALAVPPLLVQIFDSTPNTPAMMDEWKMISDDLMAAPGVAAPDSYYAYPELRLRLAAQGVAQ